MEAHRPPEIEAAAEGPGKPGALSPRDFARLSAFIEGHCGIRMPLAKKTLLEARLGARVRDLGLHGFREYCDRVLGGSWPEELVWMVDRVTTNKTDFFREPGHFELLLERVLPALEDANGSGFRRELRVWSAGCSTGEEPYTIAMLLAGVAEERAGFRFEILGTDLSTRVLRHASAAEYRDDHAAPIPLALRRKYLLRSVVDPSIVRVARRLRRTVKFAQLNLLGSEYRLPHPMDVVFCRNVFIYFERQTQAEVLRKFARALVPGGFLFLGHSETITGIDVPFDPIAPTVYRRREGA